MATRKTTDKDKPKQNRLSLEDKVKILKKLDENVRANRLALDFGVSTSAISQIKKQKEQIYEAVSESDQEAKKKTLHKAEYDEMETKLYGWFLKQRERNCPINGPIFKAKARDIFKSVYPEKEEKNFLASDGWFRNFKRRRGLRFLKVCGEILSSDTTAITPFVHQFRAKIDEMQLTNEQLYNADESALFYKLLPDKTYVAACEKTAPGGKMKKERVTFMLCSNAEGTNKIKPLVIGKSAKPRCFNGFDNPLEYDNSKNAWMTTIIFKKWFHDSFVKQVSMIVLIVYLNDLCSCCVCLFSTGILRILQVRRFSKENNLPPKALLLLDNCSAHSPKEPLVSDDGNIVAMMLPPNVTALIQPMDQNPIKIVKLKYRNMLLANVVAQADDSIHDALNNHALKDAILLLKTAWDELPLTVLQKSWSKISNWDENDYDDEDNVPLSELMPSKSIYDEIINETQLLLSNLGVHCELSIEEIEGWNADIIDDENDCDVLNEDESGEEEEEDSSKELPIPYNDAINAVNTLIKWCSKDSEYANKHVSNLLKLRSDIVTKHIAKTQKQTKLHDFFCKH